MPTCPTDLEANLRYRKELYKLGQENKTAREEIWLACKRDPIWFCNAFLWTFNPKDHPKQPERPFILWPHQERAIKKLIPAIGNHDIVFPKSRVMGGTYIILAALFHQWMFETMQSFLLCSAKEDRVDRAGDPSCLMWKLDHFIQCLPAWMRPPVDRVEMRLQNLAQENIFNGESTNDNVDRGGRRTAVLADEAAAMRNAAKIASSIQHVTNSCFWISTPQGASGAFYDLYEKYSRESPDWVCRLHWSEHPIYAKGIEWNDGVPTSPWYRQQCLRSPGPRWIAQELDIGFHASGGQYFEQDLLDRLLRTTVKKPMIAGELDYDANGDEARFIANSHGRLKLWCAVKEGQPPKGEYIAGCDIASGKGGEMSSQSAVSILNKATGEKVAEFTSNRITPTNFARYVVAICRWFHGAKLIWGSQGPGADFGKTVNDCRYHKVYTRKGDSKKAGFVESPDSKLMLMGDYLDALNEGRFVNRSKEAVEECKQFVYANGTVEHSKAIQADQDPENKGKLHGDIVVADAMVNHLLPKTLAVAQAAPPVAPKGSFAWRMQQREQAATTADDWGALNFTY